MPQQAPSELTAFAYAQEVESRLRQFLSSDTLLVEFLPVISITVVAGRDSGLVGMEISLHRRPSKLKPKLNPGLPSPSPEDGIPTTHRTHRT